MDPKPPSGATSSITSPEHQITAQSSIKDETINSCSSDAVSSPISESTQEPTNRSLSLTQSPPIQVMERHDDLDFSNRFSSSSSSNWSSVSDESLFSIHFTSSYKHDQSHLPQHSGQSDVGSLKVESLSKLDVHVSNLDEPQKVVRWKTQVEHLADGVSSQGQQPESSPSADHKSSKPKNKFSWSKCNCGSCNPPKCSCWNGCWKSMKCSNCKTKKTCSSHSKEANASTSDEPKKPGLKHQKMDFKKCCCFGSCLACFRSCSCHCCWGDISATA